jgi:pimeloyl-ACP methyl ester carboxylesterase
MRGYGDSDGDPNAFGWGATRDVDAAVAFLRAHGEERIGALGLSVGGEQLLEAAAGNVNLRAVVSDGAGERSVKETADRGWAASLVLPQRAVMTTAIAALSGDTPPVGLGDAIDAISPRPVFLVYAEHGAGGEDLTPQWFDAAGQPKLTWRVPGAGHTGGLEAQPREYERRVVAFLKDRL